MVVLKVLPIVIDGFQEPGRALTLISLSLKTATRLVIVSNFSNVTLLVNLGTLG